MLITHCLCGTSVATSEEVHGLGMIRCACGVLRQNVDMSAAELAAWYEAHYHAGVYHHSYEQDRSVANQRLDEYAISAGARLLDVGSGNGAFVEAAVERGIEAWGQELGSQCGSRRVYLGSLEDLGFPTEFFDVVTMHDVLEHVPDPRSMLKAIRRILKPGGRLIVDFPRFYHEEGRHHWKPVEHLWMLNETQLTDLLVSEGFAVDEVRNPIPSKAVIYTRQTPLPSDARILVPPGIGDGYWVLVKLRGFLQKRGIKMPEIWVEDSPNTRRSGDMWRRVPFVRFGGYTTIPHRHIAVRRAYRQPGYPVQRGVLGFDYFMSFNGTLNSGRSIDQAMTGPANWFEPLFISKEEDEERTKFRDAFGNYVVCSFWDHGSYQKWLQQYSEPQIVLTLKRLADAGYTVIVIGANWDLAGIGPRIAAQDPRFVNLVGETSFEQMTALLRGSAGVLGFPAGNTILGTYYKKPTVLLWNDHFPRPMWTNSCPPNGSYLPFSTQTAQPEQMAVALMQLMAA